MLCRVTMGDMVMRKSWLCSFSITASGLTSDGIGVVMVFWNVVRGIFVGCIGCRLVFAGTLLPRCDLGCSSRGGLHILEELRMGLNDPFGSHEC